MTVRRHLVVAEAAELQTHDHAVWCGRGPKDLHQLAAAVDGPTDPLVGLLPSDGIAGDSGRGLWIAHQLDIDVALSVGDDGFTVRFAIDVD